MLELSETSSEIKKLCCQTLESRAARIYYSTEPCAARHIKKVALIFA